MLPRHPISEDKTGRTAMGTAAAAAEEVDKFV